MYMVDAWNRLIHDMVNAHCKFDMLVIFNLLCKH
jgi:hypothetical protein